MQIQSVALTPSLGTSICCRCSPKKKKKKESDQFSHPSGGGFFVMTALNSSCSNFIAEHLGSNQEHGNHLGVYK